MICSASTPEATEFRSELRFKEHNIILSKKQSVILKIVKLLSNEKILLQHSVLGYWIDFPEHKLAIQVDEKGHTDRNERKENEREEKELGCKFIRINPDEEDYHEFAKLVNQIKNQLKRLY